MEPETLCQVRAETQSWDVERNWVWYNTVWIFKSIYNSEINPSIDVWNHLGGSVKWVKISFFFFCLSRFWLDIILLQTKQKILSAPPCSLILSLKNIFSNGKSVNWVTICLHFCISYALTGQTLDKAKERRAKPKGSLPSQDRLGPGTLCCSACTWTNISLGNKIQRNYKGLKITAYMCSWSEFWTRYKNPP